VVGCGTPMSGEVYAMTVTELMERLQKYPQEARVIVQGYEDGFDDISMIEEVTIRPFPDLRWYYGKYEKTDPETSLVGEKAVLLFGRERSE